MATIYPLEPTCKNNAERVVFKFIRDELPDDYVCYFNRIIEGKEFDFCLVIPGKAIFMIEVKGWRSDQIISVQDHNSILYESKGSQIVLRSPMRQVKGYCNNLLNILVEKLQFTIPVIPVVCYPFITAKEFEEKELYVLTERGGTLLKDELSDPYRFINLLNQWGQAVKFASVEELNQKNLYKIRSLFEPKVNLDESKSESNSTNNTATSGRLKVDPLNRKYSILKLYPSTIEIEDETIAELISHWRSGTKIIFISSNKRNITALQEQLAIEAEKIIHFHKDFQIWDENGHFKNQIFNFSFVHTKIPINDEITIFDGEYHQYNDLLKAIDNDSNFNLNQYEVEHAEINRDIVVRAGAGTGKTYSMVARINYLLYKHDYNAETLKDSIILITFTNEATKNMRIRLQENFEKYYLLTGSFEFFQLIEAIDEVKISTIDSLAKKILQRFSVALGLGKDVSIVSGKHERDQFILSELNNFIINHYDGDFQAIAQSFPMRLYDVEVRLKEIYDVIEQKNIDLRYYQTDFGTNDSNKALHNMIIHVLQNTQQQTIEYFDERNQVRLNNLIMKLNELLNQLNKFNTDHYKIDYLFVDEFQDTDDVQIELMKQFQSIFDFNFFVVGDVKQCIYRFRGAEEKAFTTLKKNSHKDQWLEYHLAKNYRTDHDLLEQFHPIFSKWGSHNKLDYQENNDRLIGTKIFNQPLSPLVCVSYTKENFEDLFIEQLKRQIEELKALNQRQSTIAILVRKNYEAIHVRNLCRKHKIYVETDSGGELYKISPTIDLYKLVLALKYNQDPKHLYNLYTTNYVYSDLPKNNLWKNKKNRQKLLEEFYNNCPINNWQDYVKRLRYYPIMSVIKDLIDDVQPWLVYANKSDLKNVQKYRRNFYKQNLDELIENIIKKFEQDYLTINKIHKYLELMILTGQEEETRKITNRDDNEKVIVVCKTIHKAKGLEYDHVVLPYCDKELLASRERHKVEVIINNNNSKYEVGYRIKFNNQLVYKNSHYENYETDETEYQKNEEIRILYVAMTRAIRKLVYFKNEEVKSGFCWQKLIEGEME